MKLLIITQIVDRKDTVMSFMHAWITKFAPDYESITVICLKKGEYEMPKNVKVLSLGKETGESRLKYLKNFYKYIFAERKNYDAVFVHMNQEYVLLGGLFWKIFGKKVFMWRNHHAGNWLTRLSVSFCDKVFCTSKFSYTAKFKKTVLMPVGIDTEVFAPDNSITNSTTRKPRSILFLARIGPVKKPDLLIKALKDIAKSGQDFTATIMGDALPKDAEYYQSLKKMVGDYGLLSKITFKKGVPNRETIRVYNEHEIFVNLSSSGMYDKTIFESMACGCLPLASNDNLRGLIDDMFIFKQDDRDGLAKKLDYLLSLPLPIQSDLTRELRQVVLREHSLEKLSTKLLEVLSLNNNNNKKL